MPRYHFHVQDGVPFPDQSGTELGDIDAAKDAAIGLAGSILREATPAGIWNGEVWKLHVSDNPVMGEGRTFFSLSFSGVEGPESIRSDEFSAAQAFKRGSV